MNQRKRTFTRLLCLCLSALMLASAGVMYPAAETVSKDNVQPVTIYSDRVTVIYVSEKCNAYSGSLFREATQGDPYFDGVRTGDWFTIPISVEKDGTYHFCFGFGWLDDTGDYTVEVDDTSVQLKNTVRATGWRDWVDSSEAEIQLTAGLHTLKVTNHTAGPNIRSLKIAPVEIPLSSAPKEGRVHLFDDGMPSTAICIPDNYAVQFHMTEAFTVITVDVASWNNDIGSLRLTLFPWAGSYDMTLRGTAVYTQDYIDFKDNSKLRMEGEFPAGEYVLYMENISENEKEEVGVWAFFGVSTRARNYQDHAETPNCARVTISYDSVSDELPLGPLSPVEPSAEGLAPSAGDLFPWPADEAALTGYKMDATSLIGVQFKADTAFAGAQVYLASVPQAQRHMTISLYRWTENYSSTVKQAPVKSVALGDDVLLRGTWVGLSGSFDAGEYLLVLSGFTDGTGVGVCEKRSETSVTYLHTSPAGVSLICRLTGAGVSLSAPSDAAPQTYVTSGSWAATDGLDRTLPGYEEVGGRREGKYVGIFYHTWHSAIAASNTPVNVSELVSRYPEAVRDYNHPAWGDSTVCFWNQPIWGYYNNGLDRWVLRKQAELLADAGVDVVFFDNTNGTQNYISAILTLCEVWAEARADGVKTPQISCMLNMFQYDQTATQLVELYDKIYSKGLYQDLWFYWDGKPLMLGYPAELMNMRRRDVYEFFSYRPINPSYTEGQDQILESDVSTAVRFTPPVGFKRYTSWKWISIYPQEKMMLKGTDTVEEMCVCVAQNWSAKKGLTAMNAGDMVFGRGYTNAHGVDTSEYAVTHGLNISEQWEYALQVDPTFIYITGWNEWVASRYEEMWGDPNAIPDNALDGYSRDIEPSTGLLKDHFYYQMVSYIRRFKGVDAPEAPVAAGTDRWEDATAIYLSYEGNTLFRDADGYRGYHYTNTTGRNDIVEARVAYDADNVYFMVRTADALTPESDPAWMRLFIDVELNAAERRVAHWETYGYVVNRVNPQNGKAILEASKGGWAWETVAEVDYTVRGDKLIISIPRAAIGAEDDSFTLGFKWSDNAQADGDVMDFYSSGDVAPGGRFKYVFSAAPGSPETEPETQPDTQPEETTSVATDVTTEATDPTDTTAPAPGTEPETATGTQPVTRPEDTDTTGATPSSAKRGCGSTIPAVAGLLITCLSALWMRKRKED